MVLFPNAKINLGLNILKKRKDGYHNISSCFYPVPLYDILEVLPASQLSIKVTGIDIPGDSNDNLVIKAYRIIRKNFGIQPVTIHLHKVIPIGAGLGGGSSDGAFMLLLLNKLFNLELNNDDLIQYASELGSDCPFFIYNRAMLVTGKGDVMQPEKKDLTGFYLKVIYPGLHISTKEAYGKVVPSRTSTVTSDIIKKRVTSWKNHLINDFEKVLFLKYPVLQEIKEKLYNTGAVYASLTGSGSALYGLFKEAPESLGSGYEEWDLAL